MNVLMNCFHLPKFKDGAGGAGMYIKSILEPLSKEVNLRIIVSNNNKNDYNTPLAKPLILDTLSNTTLESWWSWCDLYYDPQNGLTPLEIPINVPVISSIYDLQHQKLPRFFANDMINARDKDYGWAIRRSNKILTISEWEKNNILKFCENADVEVVYLSGFLFDKINRESQDILSKKFSKENYYIFPAVPWIHKNHYRLIEAIYFLNQKRISHSQEEINIVFTGSKHQLSHTIHDKLANLLKVNTHISHKGFLSDEELAITMLKAKGLIFPSMYEGYGIPIVDAYNFGLPVLCSAEACIPEIMTDKVTYFNNVFDSHQMSLDIDQFDKSISSGSYNNDKGTLDHNIDRIVKELLQIFTEIVEEPSVNKIRSCKPRTNDTDRLSVILSVDSEDEAEILYSESFVEKLRDFDDSISFILCWNKAYVDPSKSIAFKHSSIYFDPEIEQYKTLSLEYALKSVINSEYIVYSSPVEFLEYSLTKINTACSYLDVSNDLAGIKILLDIENNDYSRVINSSSEEEAIVSFEKEKKVSYYNAVKNVMFKTWICHHGGMIGSAMRLSKMQRETYVEL